MLTRFILAPGVRHLFDQSMKGRFSPVDLWTGLAKAGFDVKASRSFLDLFGWYVALLTWPNMSMSRD